MRNPKVKQFVSGVHNRQPNYEIPSDASQDSLNWVTIDGEIVLALGKQIMGVEGVAGVVYNLWFGTKNDGTKVLYIKYGTKIGYWNGTTIVAIVTGLTDVAEYSFQNYVSLAGNFTIATGVDGIYKFHNGSLGSYMSMYDSTKNFKGKSIIDKGRMIMWGLATDTTGLYGSKIDPQTTNYTLVASESIGTGNGVQTTFSGTLAFKSGNPTKSCFALKITQGANLSTDNYNGVITGTNVSIGTINYLTGDYSITFTTPPPNLQALTISYQHEDSNVNGITDFTKSATRLAGEGFIIRQDEGGDAIQRVVIGIDGSYYSMKTNSVYKLTLDSTDTKPTNEIFRKDMGISYYQLAISAGLGIVFMNTSNPDKPELTLLDKNPLGDTLLPIVLFPHFKFENYVYDQGVVDTWGRYIIVSCRTSDSLTNNRLLLCDKQANSVQITNYGMKCFAKDGAKLYGGSSLSETFWRMFGDYDDDNQVPTNYWTGKSEDFKLDNLKKTRNLLLQGKIDKNQKIEVYVGYDDSEPTLAGTIRGDGEYVDASTPVLVGAYMVGSSTVGGGSVKTVYPYQLQIKLKSPKYSVRTIKFKAIELGYASVSYVQDVDVLIFESKIAKRYRIKQNVSLDGATTDLSSPE